MKSSFAILFLISFSCIFSAKIGFLEEPKIEYINGADVSNPDFAKKLEEKLFEEGVFPKTDNKKNTNECLADDATMSEIGITDPDDNQRFAMGKCNPVVFANGVYAARLSTEINCKGLSQNKRKMQEIRMFCGDGICPDKTVTYEEHVMWPVVLVIHSFLFYF